MFGTLERGWSWLVDGLSEGVWSFVDRVTRQDAIRIEIGESSSSIRAADGEELGRLLQAEDGISLEPPDIAGRLSGAALDLLIPAPWLFRRHLDPVAAQSAPYLDAFVRHHIDRITPWRAADVHYWIAHAPLAGDPTRLSVEIGVVPKRLVTSTLDMLLALRPKRLQLVTRTEANGPTFVIPFGEHPAVRAAKLRPFVSIGLAAILLGLPGAIGGIFWETGIVQGEIDDADRVIEERKAVLAAAARHDRAGTEAEGVLRHLRDSRPRTVDVLDALSAALPDNAFLTDLTIEKEQIRMSGVSTNTPQLVPALEASGRFTDAAFFEATTRVESGAGDRFHIEMRVGNAGAGAPAP